MAGEVPAYPKRPSHFAHKAVRAMVKTCVAQEHGQGVFALLCVIAHTEDARHYTSPVTFWNEQLSLVAGFANIKAMDRQRAKAVESGWLVYIPGGNRVPGKYWVTIPPKFSILDDNPTDEGSFPIEDFGVHSPVQTSNLTIEVGNEPGLNRDRSGNRTGIEVGNEPGLKWAPFNPVPNPIPNPDVASATSVVVAPDKPKRSAKRFEEPTVEQVAAYVAEIKAGIDPEGFVNFYASKGWMVGRNPMRDWKAAVRTWARNSYGSNQGGSSQGALRPTGGNRPGGGFATHEHQREAANNAALAAFLLEEGIFSGDGGANDAETNIELHQATAKRLVLRSEAVPGQDDQSGGRGASNVGDAISGGRRPIPPVSPENASTLFPDGG